MSFKPTIWSKQIDAALHKALVAVAVTNTIWEKDITKAGEAVKIFTPGTITVSDYTQGTAFSSPAFPTDTTTTLTIDQAKMFNFAVDDIDAIQESLVKLNAYTSEAAYAVADTMDSFILSKYTDISAGNTISASTISSSTVLGKFLTAAKLLDEANVPRTGRFAIVDPTMVKVINEYLAGKSTALGDTATANGYLGTFAGFAMYMSNNVQVSSGTPDTYHNVLGHPSGWAFVHQAAKLESYRPEKLFADAVKGLHLYGAKVMDGGNRLVLLESQY